nr:NAD(P)/FAD-dependent oxidoreductase [Antrihabitans stalactiti]
MVIGAGFSGIGAAIGLLRAGIDDFAIVDENDDVGGSWHVNRYPGIAVDIAAFSYCFAFEPNCSWSSVFPGGAEMKAYADACVEKYRLRPHLRLKTKVIGADYDDSLHLWQFRLADDSVLSARFAICATGWLTKKKLPDIDGLDQFGGVVVHTADWDQSIQLTDRHVAVIGTGASAVQVVPAIAGSVRGLTVYQRTPIWLFPKPDVPVPLVVQRLFRIVPWLQRIIRVFTDAATELSFVIAMVHNRQFPFLIKLGEAVSRLYLRVQVKGDRTLIDKLTPRYGLGCKRPSFAKGYWRTFVRTNVDLVTEPVAAVTETGIRTTDGGERNFDVIVLATGFHVLDNLPPFPMRGLNGRDIREFWRTERFQAYEGSSVKGFPNLWFIVGPYSFTGGSWFGTIDHQVTHAVRVIAEARRRNATEAVVRPEKHDESFRQVLRRQRNTVFFNNNCNSSNSYYFDDNGDAPAVRPATTYEAVWRSKHFDLDDYLYRNNSPIRREA